jgi:hypothetical protein
VIVVTPLVALQGKRKSTTRTVECNRITIEVIGCVMGTIYGRFQVAEAAFP